MKIFSNNFKQGESIPSKFSRGGEDINPHLAWEDVPKNTKSFALIVDDPDALGGTWTHWLVYDISQNIQEIPEGTLIKDAKQITNDYGEEDYGGPAPPSGTHRYFFKLYALNVEKLPNPTKGNFYELVTQNTIEKAELMGIYTRI